MAGGNENLTINLLWPNGQSACSDPEFPTARRD